MNSRNISNDEKMNKIKPKINFNNIKSNFILKRIFGILKKHKELEIILYNISLQKKLNLNIDDYKEYSQLYSSIEIELKLVENKYNKFINISD